MSRAYSRLPFARRPRFPSGFQQVCWRSPALRKRMACALNVPPCCLRQRQRRCAALYLLRGSGHDRHPPLSDPWRSLLDSCADELIIRQPDFAHEHLASVPAEAVRALLGSLRAAKP